MDTPDLWTSEPVVVDTSKQAYQRIEAAPVVAYLAPTDGDVENAALAHSEERATATDDVASATTQPPAAPVSDIQSNSVSVVSAAAAPTVDAGHTQWCLARYRSYRVEDNSYQPFNGGPRQACEMPSSQMSATSQTLTQPAQQGYGQAGEQAMATSAGDGQANVVSISAGPVDGLGVESATSTKNAAMAGGAGTHEEWCHGRYRSYRADDNSYQPLDGGPRKACASPYG
jgi:hypothetical protein